MDIDMCLVYELPPTILKLLQTLELLENKCLHSLYVRKMTHDSLTAWVDLYNLSTRSVIARSQIVSFLF